MRRLFAIVVAPLLLSSGLQAASNRLFLAGQFDFGAKRGFYLDLESDSPGSEVCTLSKLKLFFAVADGKAWQFPGFAPPDGWKYKHPYVVVGSVSPQGAIELTVDGLSVAKAQGGPIEPIAGPVLYSQAPDWAAAPAEFRVRETDLTFEAGGLLSLANIQLPAPASPALYFLGKRDAGYPAVLNLKPGSSLTIHATFELEPAPSWLDLAPLVDRFGQSRYSNWPDKVTSDEDLKKAMREEEEQYAKWVAPTGYDRFGGYMAAPWKEKGTGFFRVMKRDGKWWLISPEGAPTFYTGVCTAPDVEWDFTPLTGREKLFEEIPPVGPFHKDNVWGGTEDGAYVSLQGMNVLRKYGANWSAEVTKSMNRRVNVWGFSGLGKWCDIAGKLTSLPVLENNTPKLVRHLDPFDPGAKSALKASLNKQMTPRRFESAIVGWSIGNEFDEIVTTDEVKSVLKDHATSPAATALLDGVSASQYGGDKAKRDEAWKNGTPDADLEVMRGLYATTYYELLYKTVKDIDPDHLYLGFWIVPGWWQNENDWKYAAPYCDVIGYDRYNADFADEWFTKLLASTDKPALCGEFSFPPYHDGLQGFGRYGAVSVNDEADAGAAYTKWIEDATRNPYCVGGAWFQYRDEPITGRGPGHGNAAVYGEDYAFGLVDVTDRPKWPLVKAVREANLRAAKLRLGP